MVERYLYHLTLTTGHARKSYRSEISADALRVAGNLVDQIRQSNNPVALPEPFSDYHIVGRVSGHCMTAQVFSSQSELPLVTLGIAARERCGAAIWRELGAEGNQPDAPWLAVKIEPGLVADPPAAHWLGDFERCLGWAFLDSCALLARMRCR